MPTVTSVFVFAIVGARNLHTRPCLYYANLSEIWKHDSQHGVEVCDKELFWGAQGDLNIGVCNKELCWGGRPKETWKLESVIKNSIRLVGAQGNLEDEVSR